MEQGLVIKTTGKWHTVLDSANREISCSIRGNLRTRGIRSTNPIAAGDRVEFSRSEHGNTGVITEILERKNYIIRKSSKLSKSSHILAANVDQAFLIVTLKLPETPRRFIDRFLCIAEAYRIPARIIFNKTDLYENKLISGMNELAAIYGKIGYKCHTTSAVNKSGIDKLKESMKDKINLVAGNSGVGKSTLINILEPELNIRTNEVSKYHKTGKHTTTFPEMHPLSFGGYIIDTPGIKGFGIIDIDKDELFHYFPEIFKKSENCKYYNCMHIKEPGCAVRLAVTNNEINKERYESYLSIYFEENEKYRQKGY